MMRKKRNVFVLIIVSLLIFLGSFFVVKNVPFQDEISAATGDVFVEQPIPLQETFRLFDMGVVDANGDNLLDIYTSNHNFRQTLLIADGRGGYRDVLDDWGLNQSKEFPGLELSYIAPNIDKAGLYIYWLGSGGDDETGHNVIIRAHNMGEIGQWQGTFQSQAAVEMEKNNGFQVEWQKSSTKSGTVVSFSAASDGVLVLKLNNWGVPIDFNLKGAIQPSSIFVGNQIVSPSSTSFSLAHQDRHGLAWADYNEDGRLDIFATRGGLGGWLKQNPEHVRNRIKDQFLVSQDNGRYRDVASEKGVVKENCSGRNVKWVDFNNDGLLDLYINCQDRGKVEGEFPKQLYRQNVGGQFVMAAAEAGLDIPDHQLIDFVWIDADNDMDTDLLTSEDKGYFLYRNQAGYFSPEFIGRGKFARADKPGLKYVAGYYWSYDGKLTVADYDGDGDLDAFSASKKGNTLLINTKGKFSPVDPETVGLPAKSVGANWVDYNNDGLIDMHVVPEGLFRQSKDHKFNATNLLTFPSRKYQAAISNWADLDNNGARDVVFALNENPSFWSWWEKIFKAPEDVSKWTILAYRNVGATNHWLQMKLVGLPGNRQAIGAQVTVVTPDGEQTQEVGSNEGAFFSQGHYRLYFGLGSHSKADSITIRWPDGFSQELTDMKGDELLLIERDSKT